MQRLKVIAGGLVCLGLLAAVAVAGGKQERPKPSVNFAKSWDAAVDEARLLNVPIVVHHHGFY